MARFIGEYSAKLDDKGRLIFPSAFKGALSEDEERKFVVRKDNFTGCLEMYTLAEWDRQSEKVRSQLNPAFNEKHAKFWRAYMHNCAIVEPDAKLGRITIPKKLLDLIGAQKEVVFSGSDYKIEIWAKENFESGVISNDEFISIAGMLSDMR
ncbi:MAG: division/cell wall cluster transcriptional repressor MraZ [Candidatus Cryptobacteroides sp.]